MVALERAGIPVKRYVAYEIEENSIEVSKHNYPEIEHKGDVFKAEYTEGEFDILIGGSPCFVAGTLIRTIDGLKPIEDIKVGDKVLTHKNRFKTVTSVMNRVAPSTVVVKAENCGEIECTKEHPFYTKEMNRVHNQEMRRYERVLGEDFEWVSPEKFVKEVNASNSIKKHTYLTSVTDEIKEEVEYNGVDIDVNQFTTRHVNNLNLADKHIWYLIGRWLGDGWYSFKYKKNKKRLSGVRVCCGKHEVDEFEEKMKLTGLRYYKSEERTTYRFNIVNLELAMYLKRFGTGALNKHLASEVFYLPDDLAHAFLEGYFDADGSTKDYIHTFSTVSKELAYGIKYMVNKYFKTSCSIIKSESYNDVIEGRTVNVHDTYTGTFHSMRRKQAHYFVEDSYILAPYKSVTHLDEPKTVYNMSVEDDESYVANGLVVHNCTHWSIAKAGGNRETTSSGIGWELFMQYVRALKEAKPKYFLYENNESMSDAIKEEITKQLGVEPIMVDSADFSAQIRKRYYWTNITDAIDYIPSTAVFADIEYEHDYRVCDFSKHKATMRLNEDGTCVRWDASGKGYYSQQSRARSKDLKMNTVPHSGTDKNNIWLGGCQYRKLHPIEAERLQTLPDNYTSCISAVGKRIGMCGNGWTVDVIAKFFSYLK